MTRTNIISATGGTKDFDPKYFMKAGAMAVRRCKKQALERIMKATGAILVMNPANLEGEENFEAIMLGEAAEVVQERIDNDELISIEAIRTSMEGEMGCWDRTCYEETRG